MTNPTNAAGTPAGIYCPPTFQTDPSAIKAVMAVYLERDSATGYILVTCYVAPHRDPRAVAFTTFIRHTTYLSGSPETSDNVFGPILAEAFTRQVGAVWILPSPVAYEVCQAAALEIIDVTEHSARPDSMPWLAHELSAGKHGASELAGMVIQRRAGNGLSIGTGIPLGVYFTWIAETWPVRKLPADLAPHDMAAVWLEAVTLAAYTLGAQLRFSPSYTGMVTLRQELAALERRRHAPLAVLSSERRAEVLEHAPTYLQWRSSFTAHDLERYWVYAPSGSVNNAGAYIQLHVYDRNWSFITAAREVPVGEPVATPDYLASDPGYYHLLSATPPRDWPRSRPGPFHTGTGAGLWPGEAVHDLWAWEAQIRLARRLGWHVEVEYGWHWPTRVDLRAWHDRMWTARRNARGGVRDSDPVEQIRPRIRQIAEAIVKSVGVATVGRLGQRQGRAVMRSSRARDMGARILSRHTSAEGELTGYADVSTQDLGRTDLSRPEWWATIISNANERALSALYTYAPDDTILAYVDGLYTLEPHEELEGAWDRPGGWRYKGTLYVPVNALDRLDTLTPYALARALAGYSVTGANVTGETFATLEAEGVDGMGEEAAEDGE